MRYSGNDVDFKRMVLNKFLLASPSFLNILINTLQKCLAIVHHKIEPIYGDVDGENSGNAAAISKYAIEMTLCRICYFSLQMIQLTNCGDENDELTILQLFTQCPLNEFACSPLVEIYFFERWVVLLSRYHSLGNNSITFAMLKAMTFCFRELETEPQELKHGPIFVPLLIKIIRGYHSAISDNSVVGINGNVDICATSIECIYRWVPFLDNSFREEDTRDLDQILQDLIIYHKGNVPSRHCPVLIEFSLQIMTMKKFSYWKRLVGLPIDVNGGDRFHLLGELLWNYEESITTVNAICTAIIYVNMVDKEKSLYGSMDLFNLCQKMIISYKSNADLVGLLCVIVSNMLGKLSSGNQNESDSKPGNLKIIPDLLTNQGEWIGELIELHRNTKFKLGGIFEQNNDEEDEEEIKSRRKVIKALSDLIGNNGVTFPRYGRILLDILCYHLLEEDVVQSATRAILAVIDPVENYVTSLQEETVRMYPGGAMVNVVRRYANSSNYLIAKNIFIIIEKLCCSHQIEPAAYLHSLTNVPDFMEVAVRMMSKHKVADETVVRPMVSVFLHVLQSDQQRCSEFDSSGGCKILIDLISFHFSKLGSSVDTRNPTVGLMTDICRCIQAIVRTSGVEWRPFASVVVKCGDKNLHTIELLLSIAKKLNTNQDMVLLLGQILSTMSFQLVKSPECLLQPLCIKFVMEIIERYSHSSTDQQSEILEHYLKISGIIGQTSNGKLSFDGFGVLGKILLSNPSQSLGRNIVFNSICTILKFCINSVANQRTMMKTKDYFTGLMKVVPSVMSDKESVLEIVSLFSKFCSQKSGPIYDNMINSLGNDGNIVDVVIKTLIRYKDDSEITLQFCEFLNAFGVVDERKSIDERTKALYEKIYYTPWTWIVNSQNSLELNLKSSSKVKSSDNFYLFFLKLFEMNMSSKPMIQALTTMFSNTGITCITGSSNLSKASGNKLCDLVEGALKEYLDDGVLLLKILKMTHHFLKLSEFRNILQYKDRFCEFLLVDIMQRYLPVASGSEVVVWTLQVLAVIAIGKDTDPPIPAIISARKNSLCWTIIFNLVVDYSKRDDWPMVANACHFLEAFIEYKSNLHERYRISFEMDINKYLDVLDLMSEENLMRQRNMKAEKEGSIPITIEVFQAVSRILRVYTDDSFLLAAYQLLSKLMCYCQRLCLKQYGYRIFKGEICPRMRGHLQKHANNEPVVKVILSVLLDTITIYYLENESAQPSFSSLSSMLDVFNLLTSKYKSESIVMRLILRVIHVMTWDPYVRDVGGRFNPQRELFPYLWSLLIRNPPSPSSPLLSLATLDPLSLAVIYDLIARHDIRITGTQEQIKTLLDCYIHYTKGMTYFVENVHTHTDEVEYEDAQFVSVCLGRIIVAISREFEVVEATRRIFGENQDFVTSIVHLIGNMVYCLQHFNPSKKTLASALSRGKNGNIMVLQHRESDDEIRAASYLFSVVCQMWKMVHTLLSSSMNDRQASWRIKLVNSIVNEEYACSLVFAAINMHLNPTAFCQMLKQEEIHELISIVCRCVTVIHIDQANGSQTQLQQSSNCWNIFHNLMKYIIKNNNRCSGVLIGNAFEAIGTLFSARNGSIHPALSRLQAQEVYENLLLIMIVEGNHSIIAARHACHLIYKLGLSKTNHWSNLSPVFQQAWLKKQASRIMPGNNIDQASNPVMLVVRDLILQCKRLHDNHYLIAKKEHGKAGSNGSESIASLDESRNCIEFTKILLFIVLDMLDQCSNNNPWCSSVGLFISLLELTDGKEKGVIHHNDEPLILCCKIVVKIIEMDPKITIAQEPYVPFDSHNDPRERGDFESMQLNGHNFDMAVANIIQLLELYKDNAAVVDSLCNVEFAILNIRGANVEYAWKPHYYDIFATLSRLHGHLPSLLKLLSCNVWINRRSQDDIVRDWTVVTENSVSSEFMNNIISRDTFSHWFDYLVSYLENLDIRAAFVQQRIVNDQSNNLIVQGQGNIAYGQVPASDSFESVLVRVLITLHSIYLYPFRHAEQLQTSHNKLSRYCNALVKFIPVANQLHLQVVINDPLIIVFKSLWILLCCDECGYSDLFAKSGFTRKVLDAHMWNWKCSEVDNSLNPCGLIDGILLVLQSIPLSTMSEKAKEGKDSGNQSHVCIIDNALIVFYCCRLIVQVCDFMENHRSAIITTSLPQYYCILMQLLDYFNGAESKGPYCEPQHYIVDFNINRQVLISIILEAVHDIVKCFEHNHAVNESIVLVGHFKGLIEVCYASKSNDDNGRLTKDESKEIEERNSLSLDTVDRRIIPSQLILACEIMRNLLRLPSVDLTEDGQQLHYNANLQQLMGQDVNDCFSILLSILSETSLAATSCTEERLAVQVAIMDLLQAFCSGHTENKGKCCCNPIKSTTTLDECDPSLTCFGLLWHLLRQQFHSHGRFGPRNIDSVQRLIVSICELIVLLCEDEDRKVHHSRCQLLAESVASSSHHQYSHCIKLMVLLLEHYFDNSNTFTAICRLLALLSSPESLKGGKTIPSKGTDCGIESGTGSRTSIMQPLLENDIFNELQALGNMKKKMQGPVSKGKKGKVAAPKSADSSASELLDHIIGNLHRISSGSSGSSSVPLQKSAETISTVKESIPPIPIVGETKPIIPPSINGESETVVINPVMTWTLPMISESDLRIEQALHNGIFQGKWKHTSIILKTDPSLDLIDGLKNASTSVLLGRHSRFVSFLGYSQDIFVRAEKYSTALVMECMEKGDLRSLLQQRQPKDSSSTGLPNRWNCKLRIALDICEAMRFLHESQIYFSSGSVPLSTLHVLVDQFDRAKLSISTIIARGDCSGNSEKSNVTTNNLKTPSSLSGKGKSTAELNRDPARRDIYSFGVILWELVTKKIPWEDKVMKMMKLPINEKDKDSKTCPQNLFKLIDNCMSNNVESGFVHVYDELEKLLEEVTKKQQERRLAIPDGFLCPITQDVMKDPVMLCDGHSYERKAIVDWLQRSSNRSPLTNETLPADHKVLDNYALKSAIESFLALREATSY